MRQKHQLIVILIVLVFCDQAPLSAQNEQTYDYTIQPGDTWLALSYTLGQSPEDLINEAGLINPQMQPAVGTSISLREIPARTGKLVRPLTGGMLETAARFGGSPWELSLKNNHRQPYFPLLYKSVFHTAGHNFPKELPVGFESFSLSTLKASPGQALALRARISPEMDLEISLDDEPWITGRNFDHLVALGATGAFYESGISEIRIQVGQHPIWTQHWLFEDQEWFYDKVTFTNTPVTDQDAILIERKRLQKLWINVTPEPLWSASFDEPLKEYVELTSHYGARRSVNGGPYDTYHEGTDFSAYGGTFVFAPASGYVILAEPLIVRGDAVIINHGLGVHTGYYHLSEISVQVGDRVNQGDLLGKVGSTGRSTGNHLHWDLLVGTTWVDPEAWVENNLAIWINQAWGKSFSLSNEGDIPSSP